MAMYGQGRAAERWILIISYYYKYFLHVKLELPAKCICTNTTWTCYSQLRIPNFQVFAKCEYLAEHHEQLVCNLEPVV